jgi:hypothetical protein
MEALHELNLTYLDQFLIPFNNEIDVLDTKSTESTTLNDKFYSSISKNDTMMSLTTELLKQNNDYVFDKQYVNPFFKQQNTTSTLIDTIAREKQLQTAELQDTRNVDEMFADIKRKMNDFLTLQNSHLQEERERQIKTAILEYRWLHSPKLISPFVKDFLHNCILTEFKIRRFNESVAKNAIHIENTSHNMSDCIFGFPIGNCVDEKQLEKDFNKLFLPGVYNLPKQFNTVYVFNKYIEQFVNTDREITKADTLLSLFYTTVKSINLDKSQTVANYIRQWEIDSNANIDVQLNKEDSDEIVRLKKIRHLTVLVSVLRKRRPDIKVKRIERGEISSETNEFIFKSNKLYFYERTNTWCIFVKEEKQLFYSDNFKCLFYFLLSLHTESS